MWKFHDLALQLLKDQLVTAWEDFVMPQPLQEEWIFLAHEEASKRRANSTLQSRSVKSSLRLWFGVERYLERFK